jgi:hypothetical protein
MIDIVIIFKHLFGLPLRFCYGTAAEPDPLLTLRSNSITFSGPRLIGPHCNDRATTVTWRLNSCRCTARCNDINSSVHKQLGQVVASLQSLHATTFWGWCNDAMIAGRSPSPAHKSIGGRADSILSYGRGCPRVPETSPPKHHPLEDLRQVIRFRWGSTENGTSPDALNSILDQSRPAVLLCHKDHRDSDEYGLPREAPDCKPPAVITATDMRSD